MTIPLTLHLEESEEKFCKKKEDNNKKVVCPHVMNVSEI